MRLREFKEIPHTEARGAAVKLRAHLGFWDDAIGVEAKMTDRVLKKNAQSLFFLLSCCFAGQDGYAATVVCSKVTDACSGKTGDEKAQCVKDTCKTEAIAVCKDDLNPSTCATTAEMKCTKDCTAESSDGKIVVKEAATVIGMGAGTMAIVGGGMGIASAGKKNKQATETLNAAKETATAAKQTQADTTAMRQMKEKKNADKERVQKEREDRKTATATRKAAEAEKQAQQRQQTHAQPPKGKIVQPAQHLNGPIQTGKPLTQTQKPLPMPRRNSLPATLSPAPSLAKK